MAEKGLNGRKIAKLPCQLLAVSRNVLSINVSWNRVGVEPLRGNLTRLEGGVFVTSGQVGGITTGKMILTRRLIDAIRRGGCWRCAREASFNWLCPVLLSMVLERC